MDKDKVTHPSISDKYQGRYAKAMTGRSPTNALACMCLICVSNNLKEIRNCTDKICPARPYRPWQENGKYKSRKGSTRSNLGRQLTGINKILGQRRDRPVSQTITLQNPGTEKITLEVKVK